MNDTNNIVPKDDQPAKPQYIENQTNNNCQQFFGPISGCVFAMPGATVAPPVVNAPQDAKPQKNRTKPQKTEQKPALPKQVKKTAPSKPRELMTFTKRGILTENIKLLYQQMIDKNWITKDTQEEDFIDLFSGKPSECKIYWSSNGYGKSTLVYLFQQLMHVEELITLPKGFTIPNVLMGHFVDENEEFLTNLDKGDAPNDKAGPDILEFIKTLKLNANRAGRRSKRSDYQDEDFVGYGEDLNPYDLEEEGLNVHKGRF